MEETKKIVKEAAREDASVTFDALASSISDGTGSGLGKGPDLTNVARSTGGTPTYTSPYSEEIDRLKDQILYRKDFSYNPEEDENYLQYKDSYTKAGKRAMADTIGEVSANTGGMASSYAETAGQQAYNNYMGALADKIPELRQLAYEMYQDDLNYDLQKLGVLQGLESTNYGRYRDNISDYYTDRNYNYQVDRDKVLDRRYDDQWDYQKATDQRDYLQSEYQFDANRTDRNNQFQMSYDSQERANALNRVITMGYVTKQDAEILGIPEGEPTFSSLLALSQLNGGMWSGHYWANHPITKWANEKNKEAAEESDWGGSVGEIYAPGASGVNLLAGGRPVLSYDLKPVGNGSVNIPGNVSDGSNSEGSVETKSKDVSDKTGTEYDDSKYGRDRENYPTVGGKPITNETDGKGENWIKVSGERMGMVEFTERLEAGEFETINNEDGSVTYRKK